MGNFDMQHTGRELYQKVRGKLVIKGTTLNRWCIENGVTRQWAEKALKGERKGNASRELVKRIVEVAGIDQ